MKCDCGKDARGVLTFDIDLPQIPVCDECETELSYILCYADIDTANKLLELRKKRLEKK